MLNAFCMDLGTGGEANARRLHTHGGPEGLKWRKNFAECHASIYAGAPDAGNCACPFSGHAPAPGTMARRYPHSLGLEPRPQLEPG